jgi:hypothetical protein
MHWFSPLIEDLTMVPSHWLSYLDGKGSFCIQCSSSLSLGPSSSRQIQERSQKGQTVVMADNFWLTTSKLHIGAVKFVARLGWSTWTLWVSVWSSGLVGPEQKKRYNDKMEQNVPSRLSFLVAFLFPMSGQSQGISMDAPSSTDVLPLWSITVVLSWVILRWRSGHV